MSRPYHAMVLWSNGVGYHLDIEKAFPKGKDRFPAPHFSKVKSLGLFVLGRIHLFLQNES